MYSRKCPKTKIKILYLWDHMSNLKRHLAIIVKAVYLDVEATDLN